MIIKFEAMNIFVETYVVEQTVSGGTHVPRPSLLYIPMPKSGGEPAQLRRRTGQKWPETNAGEGAFNHGQTGVGGYRVQLP